MEPEFPFLGEETPSQARVEEIIRHLSIGLRTAKLLPSDRVLVVLCFVGYLCLALLIGAIVGFQGWEARRPGQRLVEDLAVLLSAGLLAVSLVRSMVPGSRKSIPAFLSVLIPLATLCAIVPLLFPDFSTNHFVQKGIPCLRLGTLCAIPAAGLAVWFLRKGYVTDRLQTSVITGALSGWIGIGVLTLHCPLKNTPHILLWHVGAFVVSVLAGALTGWMLSRPELS